MAKSESEHITSSTIVWESSEGILSVVTKILQTEIQVRHYDCGVLIGGRIWPMSEQQKQELYSILYKCIYDWERDDYSADGLNSDHWQFKICTQRKCLRTVCGTTEPPPYGREIKKFLVGIIGEDNCYFF